MGALLWMVALLAVAVGTFASDYPCTLKGKTLDCTDKGFILVPPGYWPDITLLILSKNPITEFPKNSFSGFPNVTNLLAENTLVAELDFGDLAMMPNLKYINLQENKIQTITSAPSDQNLPNLISIYLFGNGISSLDPDIFYINAPNLETLSLNSNPIVFEPGRPVINHPNLQQLWVGMGSSVEDLDSTALSGLPNLQLVSLPYANITNVSNSFVNNRALKTIFLIGNAITEITSNTFAPEGIIEDIDLQHNPLQRLDTSAVNKPMESGGRIKINYTPLACDCAYEALYWWAISKDVLLSATCSGPSQCSFTGRRSTSSETASPEQAARQEWDVLGKFKSDHIGLQGVL